MATRHRLLLSAAIVLTSIQPVRLAASEEFFVGCHTRPACGKVCRLVCETKKLTAVCYGCECKAICIPGPSRAGCKRCETCRGKDDGEVACGPCGHDCQAPSPECKFCWRDWFACGCATPRTVKVLTKYQAEKEISWHYWKVVDAVCCECAAGNSDRSGCAGPASPCHCVFKPAPPDAALGETFPLSDEECVTLASFATIHVAGATELRAGELDPIQLKQMDLPPATPRH